MRETSMASEQPLCALLLLKIQEQIDRTSHLTKLLPIDRPNWKPAIRSAWPIEMLLGHLLNCLAGFCAVLAAVEPERLAHFSELRDLPVNHTCSPGDTVSRIAIYRARIDEGFALLQDANLGKTVGTVFVEHGEPLLTLLLGNLEHLINHKHQLFTYLKQMGVTVNTRDLYRLRGE
jgi:DinB superfamily